MDREFAAQLLSAASRFDRINVADEVGDSDVGCGQFLDVALFGRQIGDLGFISLSADPVTARPAKGRVRIVMDFASCDVGRLRIEQASKCPQDSTLCLATQAQQNEIVAGEDRVHQLWDHGIVIADDARKYRAVSLQASDQIFAQFVLNSTIPETLFGEWTLPQLAQSARKTHDRDPHRLRT